MTLDERLVSIENVIRSSFKNVLTADELSAYMGVSKSYIYKLCSNSEIPCYKRGKSVFFKRTEIEDWLLSERKPTKGEIDAKADEYVAKHKFKDVF